MKTLFFSLLFIYELATSWETLEQSISRLSDQLVENPAQIITKSNKTYSIKLNVL